MTDQIPLSDHPAPLEPMPPGALSLTGYNEAGDALSLHRYAERAYLTYAMSVVKSRALPDVADGQKPVVRRILFAMRELGLTSTSKHIKSARVVGEVIGKYHPHGDTSVYEAMVLTAQDFTKRYPLVDGQGNFGSRDGDGAAAMRYTEARITPIAELLLSELDMGTVDFIANYDGSFQMPGLLPARLPFVLLNGTKGPAVGYAPEIPSHNLREVAAATVLLIKKPDASVGEVMALLPAPDFPGGGQIISSPATIRQAYDTGRGGIRMRARWRVENQAKGQWRVIVDELPHGVSTANVLFEIEAASNPQVKTGKKELSQDQKNIKALMLCVLDAVRDESNEQSPVRLVIEPKSSRITAQELMNVLLVHTGLECSVPINLVMLGRDGTPSVKSVVEILKEWIDFRFVTVERRTRHRLSQVDARLHTLEGRMIAFLSIEEIIKVIRSSDEPKAQLIERFSLSALQADDILEIRLRQLARLEGVRIEKEIVELNSEKKSLHGLLESRPALTRQILKEIESDAKKYGDDRRTIIMEVQATKASTVKVADEPCTVFLSKNGWIRSRQGHGIDRSTVAYKAGDAELFVIEMRTPQSVVMLDNNGRAYSVKALDAPGGRGDGIPVSSLIELQSGSNGAARILHAWADAPEARYLFTNSTGYGFVATISDLCGGRKAGKTFMTVDKNELVLPPVKLTRADSWLGVLSSGPSGTQFLMFPFAEVKPLNKGKGGKLMSLKDAESLISVAEVEQKIVEIQLGAKTLVLKNSELAKFKMSRGQEGLPVAKSKAPAPAGSCIVAITALSQSTQSF